MLMEDTAALILGLFSFVFVGGFILLYAAMFAFLIFAVIIWVIMLVDCIKRDFPKPDDKILWVLVIVLTGWIGAVIYYFMIKRKLG